MASMEKQSPKKTAIAFSLNAFKGSANVAALNFKLDSTADIPSWLLFIPAEKFGGRDGRAWNNSQPQAVIDDVLAQGVDLPFDLEHSTEILAPQGMPAPAVGRIRAAAENFSIIDGAIHVRVDWNEAGKAALNSEEYFSYSPVFYHDPKTMIVTGIKSGGLTNNPNLKLTALNSAEAYTMNEFEKLLEALGLASGTSVEAAVSKINSMKQDVVTAENSAKNPSLANFVPRADYDISLNRATEAEAKVEAFAVAARDTAINSLIDSPEAKRKISPATRDYHIAQCQQEGGIERFKEYLAAAPDLIGGDSDLDDKKPAGDATALNAAEKEVAKMLNISEAEFIESKKTSAA